MMKTTQQHTLYYIHDPMCSWCWAARPVWEEIQNKLPSTITVKYLLGGLAVDTDEAMPAAMQQKLSAIWQHIQQSVPATQFNFDFWTQCQPRRSTYPACRAVIAARQQGNEFEEKMILAIQQAYYLQARNPSDNAVLIDLAKQLGLVAQTFTADINSEQTQQQLLQEIQLSHSIGAHGFPNFIVQKNEQHRRLNFEYNNAQVLLDHLAVLSLE